MLTLSSKGSIKHPNYFVESHLTSLDDDDCEITLRRNGTVFYLKLSFETFGILPSISEQYLKYLEVLRSGEETDDIYEDDVYDWMIQPFELLLIKLAPDLDLIHSSENRHPTLHDYLYPRWFILTLDAIDNELVPRQVEAKRSGRMTPGVWLSTEFLKDLRTWVAAYTPSEVQLHYSNLEDVLNKMPKKVYVTSKNENNACYYKQFWHGASNQATMELLTYKKIATSQLDLTVRICRLEGVVQDERGFLIGMLLTYVDGKDRTLSAVLGSNIPRTLSEQWTDQINSTLSMLHKVGVFWGDAKADNVMIDNGDNAWLIDFGGGYTEGWVDKDKAGTEEGD